MRSTPTILAATLLASALGLPATAGPPGNYSLSYDEPVVSVFDFKAGVGIADPTDPTNPCTILLLDIRQPPPRLDYWKTDLRVGTNLNGPAVGVSNLVPPLAPVGGWLAGSGGIPLGVPCPSLLTPGYPNQLWLVWSGVNWRSAEEDAFTEINLCSQLPGVDCVPIPGTQTVIAAACGNGEPLPPADWSTAAFAHDYGDGKGKDLALWDLLAMKNDQISCPIRHAHDYSSTITNFGVNRASQEEARPQFIERIKNEAVVHAGTGTTYMVVCWQVSYLMFPGPITPLVARTHDWKLIVDLADVLAPTNLTGALVNHLGPGPADAGPGGPTALLRGLYSESPTPAGENGFGPCPTSAPPPERKKPVPLL
jgi:hypothetical protein